VAVVKHLRGNEAMSSLEKEVAELKRRIAELEGHKSEQPFVPKPVQRFDPTANFGMPPSAVAEMAKAVPASLMRDIFDDARRGPIHRPTSLLASPQQAAPVVEPSGSGGWTEPLNDTVPGVALVDELCLAQDARERADLEHERLRRAVEAKEFMDKIAAEQRQRNKELDEFGLYPKGKTNDKE
jgi:hypothetical protein